jgi:two-component system, cell cycle sensor histidine kinase and response regulator CckA
LYALTPDSLFDSRSAGVPPLDGPPDAVRTPAAEPALPGAAQQFRALIEHSSDIISILDADGTIRYESASIERVLGYDPEELVGRSAFELLHPEDLAQVTAVFVERLAHPGVAQTLEFRFRHKDGSWRILEAASTNLLHDPDVRGLVINSRDITERRQAEAALRKVSASTRCIVWSSHVVELEDDLDWILEVKNPDTAQRVLPLDIPPGEDYAYAWYHSRPQEDRDRMARESNAALRAGKQDYRQEFRSLGRDGRMRWFLEEAHVESLAPGRWYVTGICTDITERKQSEAALREANDALQALIDASPLAILTLDVDGTVRSWNAAAEQMFGWTAHEALGRRVPFVTEDQWPEFEALWELVAAGKTLSGAEVHRRRRDGTGIEMSIYAAPLRREDGSISGALATVADITERKRAEEALRRSEASLAHAQRIARLGNWDLDLVRNELRWSEQIYPIFGFVPGQVDDLSTAFWSSVHPADREAVREAVRATRQHARPYDVEHRIVRPDGSERIVREQAEVLLNEAGSPVWMIGTVQDVTERRHLEEQLRQSQKMEAVGRLAGGVAHDFNNMLAVINGYSDLLLSTTAPSADSRVHLEQIRLAGERAARLTRQLLAFSRKQILAPRVLNLGEVVAGMDQLLRRLIGEDILVTTSCQAGLGQVKADPGQVEQVVMNLAVNARDAMPHGGHLPIETRNVRFGEHDPSLPAGVDPGRYVLLAVRDTGLGMDPETLSHIFEPFFTTKGVGEGTGLGLATVHGIVQQSGGHVLVESQAGKGTTFRIYLPRCDEAAEEAATEEAPAAPHRGSETVLLVEDEPLVRKLVQDVLRMSGYEVLVAASSQHALELCAQHSAPIDLLLTDVVMPHHDGPDLAGRIRALRPETRVLFMSGYMDDLVVRHGGLPAGSAFIEKPFKPSMLAQKIREVLS